MKSTLWTFCCLLSLTLVGFSQSTKTSIAVFKRVSFNPVVDSTSENILEVDAFAKTYGDKTRSVSIEYLTWSPKMHFIAVVVSQIYTGDNDDIWLLSVKDKKIRCITSVFPHDNNRTFSIPMWENDDTLIFAENGRYVVYDVTSDILYSRTQTSWNSNPLSISPNNEFRYEEDGTGAGVSIYDRYGKKKCTIGEGKTRSGSMLGYAFSGDSKFLAVEQFMGHGESRIILSDLSSFSVNLCKLSFHLFYSVKGRSNWYPGKSILYVTDDQGDMHFLDVKTRSDRTFSIPGYYILGAAWSPDGTRLALILQKQRAMTYAVRIIKNPIAN